MATLTIAPEDQSVVRRGLDRGIRVLRQLGPDTYETTSSRPGVTHRVWCRGYKANCDCELSALGHKRCPHAAMTVYFVAWQRQQEAER